MSEISKIVILGNSGFIGQHLESFLKKNHPHYSVLGLSSRDVDLTDEKAVEKLSTHFDLNTAVVMCSMVKKQFGDNIDSYTKNVKMAINLNRLLENVPAKRFIYISSSGIYGEEIHNTSITEETLCQSTSFYGMAKLASEQLLQKAYARYPHCSLVMLRPPTIYGSGDRLYTYGPAGFIQKAIKNEKIVLWGDGSELREFVYIGDLIHVINHFLQNDYAGTVNVVSGVSYTFKQILEIIEKNLGRSLDIEIKERSKKKVDNAFKNDLIKSLMPGFTFTPLEKGIQQTLEKELGLLK